MAVVQDVEECQRSIFGYRLGGGWVDEVPCGADVGVWDVEGGVEWFEGVEVDVSSRVLIRVVDFFVLGLVCWAHVPVEAVFQSWRIFVIVYSLELRLAACQGAVGLDQMGLRFGYEPVGESLRYICVFLGVRSAYHDWI